MCKFIFFVFCSFFLESGDGTHRSSVSVGLQVITIFAYEKVYFRNAISPVLGNLFGLYFGEYFSFENEIPRSYQLGLRPAFVKHRSEENQN